MRLEIILFLTTLICVWNAGSDSCFVRSLNQHSYSLCLYQYKYVILFFFVKVVAIGYYLQKNVHEGRVLPRKVLLPVLSFGIIAVVFLYVEYSMGQLHVLSDISIDQFRMGNIGKLSGGSWMGVEQYQRTIGDIQNLPSRPQKILNILNISQQEQILKALDIPLPLCQHFPQRFNQLYTLKLNDGFSKEFKSRNKQVGGYFSYLKSQRLILSIIEIVMTYAIGYLGIVAFGITLVVVLMMKKMKRLVQCLASIQLGLILVGFIGAYFALGVTYELHQFDTLNLKSGLNYTHPLLDRLFINRNSMYCFKSPPLPSLFSFQTANSTLKLEAISSNPPTQSTTSKILQIISQSIQRVYEVDISCQTWKQIDKQTQNIRNRTINTLLTSTVLLSLAFILSLAYVRQAKKPTLVYESLDQTDLPAV